MVRLINEVDLQAAGLSKHDYFSQIVDFPSSLARSYYTVGISWAYSLSEHLKDLYQYGSQKVDPGRPCEALFVTSSWKSLRRMWTVMPFQIMSLNSQLKVESP